MAAIRFYSQLPSAVPSGLLIQPYRQGPSLPMGEIERVGGQRVRLSRPGLVVRRERIRLASTGVDLDAVELAALHPLGGAGLVIGEPVGRVPQHGRQETHSGGEGAHGADDT